MKLEVTRNVVSDLWPLCHSGDASADSHTLVDAYLAEDSSLAATLKESVALSGVMPGLRLSPDAERRLLDQARERARMKLIIVGVAVGLVGLVALLALGGAMFIAARGF